MSLGCGMKAKALVFYIILSTLVILLFSLTGHATVYKEVRAEDILKKIENDEDVKYTNCRIVGEINLNEIKLKTVPNPSFFKLVNEGTSKEELINLGYSEGLHVIESNISITNSIFENSSDFSKVLFNRPTNFIQSTFNKPTNFSQSTFNSSVDFSNAKFNSYAYFSNAKFNSETYFSNAEFNSPAYFWDVKFNSSAYFSNAKFNSSADFLSSTLNSDANFSKVTFNSYVNFLSSSFKSSVNFYVVNFNSSATFTEVKFYSDASFFGATFNNLTYFMDAKFNSDANFGDAKFYSPVHFTRATISSANISHATFYSSADFYDAKFSNNASFFGTKFNSDANFGDAKFNSSANFSNAKFNSDTDFSDAKFNSDTYFLYLTFNSSANFLVPDTSEKIFTDGKTCELFMKSYNGEARYTDADNIYYNYRIKTLEDESFRSFSKWIDFLSLITSGFGTNITYTLGCVAAFIILFAILYKNPGVSLLYWIIALQFVDAKLQILKPDEYKSKNEESKNTEISLKLYWGSPGIYRLSKNKENKKLMPMIYRSPEKTENKISIISVWEFLYFSINAFTRLGSSDWQSEDNFRKLETVEGLIGWIMLGVFLSTLNHLMLRS
jgi:hypothetical protein